MSIFFITVWSPALRTGTGWGEYLLFDFLATARLNGVRIGNKENINGKTYRVATSVKIEVSMSLPFYNYVVERGIPPDNIVRFDKAVEARYARLTIVPTMDNPDASPIGVNQ